jgi:hypothetical protein
MVVSYMEMSQERLLLIVDHLEALCLERLAFKSVMREFEGHRLPSWSELQIHLAAAKRTLQENEQDYSKPFSAVRQRICEQPNLDRAIQFLVENLP